MIKKIFNFSGNQEGIKEEDINSTIYRKINRILAVKSAKWLARHTTITPNQITIIPLLLYILTAYLFYLASYPALIAGGIVFLLSYFMDQLNGSLARIKGMANDFGRWLDGVSDTFGLALIYFGATLGLSIKTDMPYVWLFGFLSVTSYLFGNWLYVTYNMIFSFSTHEIESIKKKRSFMRNFFYNGNFIILMFALAGFLNKMYWLLAFFSVYGWIYCFAIAFGLTKSIAKHYR